MDLQTERLFITDLREDMAEAIHRNSMDQDTRRFVPDEVFETIEEAREAVTFLLKAGYSREGPLVCPILLKKDGSNIGYVQLCRIAEGWEIGYHVAMAHTGKGYATEALRAFVPYIMKQRKLSELYGISLAENRASCCVLEKCGFALFFRGESLYQGKRQMVCKYRYQL